MKRRILAVVLVLSLALGSSFSGMVLSQSQYSLELKDRTWDHSSISVLILYPANASWWKPSFLDAAVHAVGEWNDALVDFASNYSTYAYLSEVRLVPTVSNVSMSGFDVYVSWAETLPGSAADVLGVTLSYATGSGVFLNCTISMASKDQFGLGIGEADMQNGVVHELGHTLGLGHTSVAGDVMSSAVILGAPVRAVSSLDEYGVATVFNWMSRSSQFSFGNWLGENSVTLPSGVQYRYSPVSSRNSPPQSILNQILTLLQTLTKYIFQAIMGPGSF